MEHCNSMKAQAMDSQSGSRPNPILGNLLYMRIARQANRVRDVMNPLSQSPVRIDLIAAKELMHIHISSEDMMKI